MATAFMGYVLPFGQMSFWGATVITNLLSPFPSLIEWVSGGHYVYNPTLKRFFLFHFQGLAKRWLELIFFGIPVCCIRNFHTNFNLLFNDAAVNLSKQTITGSWLQSLPCGTRK